MDDIASITLQENAFCLYSTLMELQRAIKGKIVYNESVLNMLDELMPGIKDEINKNTVNCSEEDKAAIVSAILYETTLASIAFLTVAKERYYDEGIFEVRDGIRIQDLNVGMQLKMPLSRAQERTNLNDSNFEIMVKIFDTVTIFTPIG